MFKRKDEDMDLLGDNAQETEETNKESGEPKMTTDETKNSSANDSSTTAPAATPPVAPAPKSPAVGGYNRPAESGSSRPTSFRPAPSASGSAAARGASDFRGAASPTPAGKESDAPAAASPAKSSRRVLTVGNDILLKGEIATCDRLVIEGAVDATLNEVHTVEIAQTGSFKGSAEIEDAEISGEFDGELSVRGRLVIYSTGKVRGKISYGEIEIERGGQMTGTIKQYDPKDSQKERAPAAAKKEKEAA